ncbi:MAG TPA: acetate/propionate family kinase [Tepidisphaeraceae bacterium]|jgi:acetate kinase|nr:acetate/propionate family kinase [Tepidisphaeraceae bacterium]
MSVGVTINGGSSSIKFAAFEHGDPPKRTLSGQIERIGTPGTALTATSPGSRSPIHQPIDASDHRHAADRLIDWILQRIDRRSIHGVGHRVVHGGVHLVDHQLVTGELIAELKRTQPLDLAHLPREIALIEAFHERFPDLPQVACFDTAFHRDMPRVARLLPIPRKYDEAGLRRFGFHGLSYAYLMEELGRVGGKKEANGKVILAHLGSGASMAGVHGGKPIDTTMAFTPLAGLVMGTRPGDLDPGLLVYLMRVEKMAPERMDDFLSHECGLIGISRTSSDMRDLSSRRDTDVRAAEAVDLFCYRARQWIGALAAAMNGVNTLVFSGGIGEHATDIRSSICADMDFLGIRIDQERNETVGQSDRSKTGADADATRISSDHSPVCVRVIATDEEVMIAKSIFSLVK